MMGLILTFAIQLATLGAAARAAGFPFDVRGQAQANAQSKELVQNAFAASEAGDSARALALLDQAARLRPDQPDALNLRGAILLRQGDYPRAEAAFARAAALDPDLWAARFNLAEVPFRHREYARARTLFDRLVSQTDRYKATNQWELAQYKALLCSLLLKDESDAQHRLAKLTPATATPSPIFLFGQAAAAFARKDAANANRLLAAAQGAGKPGSNAIFLRSLEAAGWVSALPAVPVGMPPSMAVAGGPSRGGGGAARGSQAVISNQPITEPELPGADPGTSAGVNASSLTGGGGGRRGTSGRPTPGSRGSATPALTILPDPVTPPPSRESTRPGVEPGGEPPPAPASSPSGEPQNRAQPQAGRRSLDLNLLVHAVPPPGPGEN